MKVSKRRFVLVAVSAIAGMVIGGKVDWATLALLVQQATEIGIL